MRDRIERVLPLHLKGPAWETYWLLSKEQQGDVEEIRNTLIKANSMNFFVAFDHFAKRQLRPGETVDKFLTELQRLALLLGWLVVEFYDISTFVVYLMPNPFYTYNQFYFKQFSLEWIHSLIVENIIACIIMGGTLSPNPITV